MSLYIPTLMGDLPLVMPEFTNEDYYAIALFLKDEAELYSKKNGKQFTFKPVKENNQIYKYINNSKNRSDEEQKKIVDLYFEINASSMSRIEKDIKNFIKKNWPDLSERKTDALYINLLHCHRGVVDRFAKSAHIVFTEEKFLQEIREIDFEMPKNTDKIIVTKTIGENGPETITLEFIKDEQCVFEKVYSSDENNRTCSNLSFWLGKNWCTEFEPNKAPIDTVEEYITRKTPRADQWHLAEINKFIDLYKKNNDIS